MRMRLLIIGMLLASPIPSPGAEKSNSFVGSWALTIPGGGAGWLGVTEQAGYLDGSILWGGGSVVPVSSVWVDDGRIHVVRIHEVKRKDGDGKVVRVQQFPELLMGELAGDEIRFQRIQPNRNGRGANRETFSGKRLPAVPASPDLKQLKFGDPVTLFNGRDLAGWKLTNPGQKNGWRVENGELVNEPKQQEGKPHVSYGNLRTEGEFEDFNLKMEVKVHPGGNSGIYLRGIYEIQVSDSFGKPLNAHHMGGVYSRICPTVNAEKEAGEWQQFDITLVDRHVTVVLNGKTIIDNQAVEGCTGGALWSDPFRPGPIYLQGDHTGVSYRNIVLRPVVK